MIGAGPYPDIGFILAARKPDNPQPPTVSIVGTKAVIKFYLPYNGGSEITSAHILIRKHDGVTFTEDTSVCDGSDATTFLNRQCVIYLTFGETISSLL